MFVEIQCGYSKCLAFFLPKKVVQRYCSPRCRKEGGREKKRAEKVLLPKKFTRKCLREECRSSFQTNRETQLYCSKRCYKSAKDKRYAKTEHGKEAALKARQSYSNTEKGRAASLRGVIKFSKNNPDKISAQRRKSHARRYKNDSKYKMRMLLRGRMRNALKANLADKKYSTVDLLGCSFEELRSYLESKWKSGMSWDNYSGVGKGFWVIDHIIPCCQFDLMDEEQQRECFHFTNLQPLWYNENIRKSKVDKAGM